jgi:hypothetical protein
VSEDLKIVVRGLYLLHHIGFVPLHAEVHPQTHNRRGIAVRPESRDCPVSVKVKLVGPHPKCRNAILWICVN